MTDPTPLHRANRDPRPIPGWLTEQREKIHGCIRGCISHGRHLPTCHDTTCRGCLPRPTGAGMLCPTCYQRLEDWLTTQLLTAWTWLGDNLGQHVPAINYDRDTIRTSRNSTAPLRLDVHDTRTRFTDCISGWEDAVRTHYNQPTNQPVNITDACRYLTAQLPRLDRDDTANDLLLSMWEELDDLVREAHQVAPWRPADRHLNGIPCPNCSRTTLTITDGSVDVTCQTCEKQWTREQYDRWTALLAWEQTRETA